MERERERGVVTLCANGECCPTVDFTFAGKVIIRDDLGGQVQLTLEEWNDLKDRFVSAN